MYRQGRDYKGTELNHLFVELHQLALKKRRPVTQGMTYCTGIKTANETKDQKIMLSYIKIILNKNKKFVHKLGMPKTGKRHPLKFCKFSGLIANEIIKE